MATKILRMDLELQSNRELTVNGVPIEKSGIQFEEQIFAKRPSLEHQWMAICELKKLLNRMTSSYDKARIERGDITHTALAALKRDRAKLEANTAMRRKPGWM